jgi:hypothetical protein
MTSDKARKAATRQRMAQTGEPYSVARKATRPGSGDPGPGETPEERYLREAEESGVSAADLAAMRAAFQAAERVGSLRQAAEQARERADRAEEDAVRAEERAGFAQEAAELAEEWADEDERRLAQERAGQMQEAAEQARERADRAEEAADEAGERADEAEEWADEAQDLFAEEGEEDEWRDDEPGGPWHGSRVGMPRLPRPPRPPRPPRLPRLPRLP